MYFVGDIPNAKCKASLYRWNGKFFLKFETPDMEQTFKISETDVSGEEEVKAFVTEEFLEKVVKRFESMYEDMGEALNGF